MKSLKLILLSSTFLFLTGCSTLKDAYDAYMMAGYDTNEYFIISEIRTRSDLAAKLCDNQEEAKQVFDELYAASLLFKNYTQNIPRNKNAHDLSLKLFDLSSQGKKQYDDNEKVSPGFCKLKLQQINRSAESIQKVIGSKLR